jgi:hypothetical protein
MRYASATDGALVPQARRRECELAHICDILPLSLFMLCSIVPVMWSKADELRLSNVMGLRDGLRLIRGMRRALTEEEEQHKIAGKIVEHLESTNWKI